MAVNAHVLVQQTVRNTDVPRDYCSHSLYFTTTASSAGAPDWTALAGAVKDAFFNKPAVGTTPFDMYSGRGGLVKVYDLADAKPRPIKGTASYTPGTWESLSLAPRLLACCLSYYHTSNQPHTRGRIYIGPFLQGSGTELVPTSKQNAIIQLAKNLEAIALLGSISWNHAVHSGVTNLTQVVDHWWVNDVWDAQHSREGKEASRIRYP